MTLESSKQELRESIKNSENFLSNLLTQEGFQNCMDHLYETQNDTSRSKAEYYTLCMVFLQILSKGIKPNLVFTEHLSSNENILRLSIGNFTFLKSIFPHKAGIKYTNDKILMKALSSWGRDGIFRVLLIKVLNKVVVYK